MSPHSSRDDIVRKNNSRPLHGETVSSTVSATTRHAASDTTRAKWLVEEVGHAVGVESWRAWCSAAMVVAPATDYGVGKVRRCVVHVLFCQQDADPRGRAVAKVVSMRPAHGKGHVRNCGDVDRKSVQIEAGVASVPKRERERERERERGRGGAVSPQLTAQRPCPGSATGMCSLRCCKLSPRISTSWSGLLESR